MPFAVPPLVYRLEPGASSVYQVQLVVDGQIPILGGQNGTAQVDMKLRVDGQTPEPGRLAATYEIADASISFNKNKLSFVTLQNFVDYFPKASIGVTPTGRVVTTTAAEKKVPVRLPGLDQKRLPETTFLPIELPPGEPQVGTQWQFSRSFGASSVDYSCTLTELSGNLAKVQVRLKQDLEYDENESLEAVTKDAVHHVKTSMVGQGTVEFSVDSGSVARASIENTSVSQVTDLETKTVSERRMATHLSVLRQGGGQATASVAPVAAVRPETPLQRVLAWGRGVLQQTEFALALVRSILVQFLRG